MTVAVAAIYLACLPTATDQLGVALPMRPRPWWELFDVRSESELHEVCEMILAVHDRWQGPISVWQRAAELQLPLTKAAVRSRIESER